MNAQEPFKIEFHQNAAARFNELAREIMNSVASFGPVEPPLKPNTELHPVAEIPADDIIGEVVVRRSSVNLLGEETGRYWDSTGLRVGWEGEKFDEIKELTRRFEVAVPIKGRVSHDFLLDEIFEWLRGTLELKRTDSLTDYIAGRCSTEIKDHEIWIPVYRTYSEHDLAIGDVEFRTISKAMLDPWFARLAPDGVQDRNALYAINRERSNLQGCIAARIRVKAEARRARAIAHAAANEAVGLLRFLSPVNWTCKLVSYCLPVGMEHTRQTTELFVENEVVKGSNKESIEKGPPAWSIDEARQTSPGLLEALDTLASGREVTEFRRDLYGALQLHSRSSISVEVSHKIVFVTAAIESLLLKDTSEPIQKNLGERMAFLIGNSLDERKGIARNVGDFYRIRSDLIHHGREADSKDTEVIDRFFFNVWFTFTRLLIGIDQYRTRVELLEALEDRKLS